MVVWASFASALVGAVVSRSGSVPSPSPRGEHANLGLDLRPLGGQPFDGCRVVVGCVGAA
jgi:hypothetical protein